MVILKLLITVSFLHPLVLCANNEEFGPFDVPLAHKLKGLDYATREHRVDNGEGGIKEAVERKAKIQQVFQEKAKVAEIPSIEELLADLPTPLLRSLENRRRELKPEFVEALPKADVRTVGTRDEDKAQTAPSTASLMEAASTSQQDTDGLFPSELPPPPIESPQGQPLSADSDPQNINLNNNDDISISETYPTSPSLASPQSSLLSSSLNNNIRTNQFYNELQDPVILPPANSELPSFDSIPAAPQPPSLQFNPLSANSPSIQDPSLNLYPSSLDSNYIPSRIPSSSFYNLNPQSYAPRLQLQEPQQLLEQQMRPLQHRVSHSQRFKQSGSGSSHLQQRRRYSRHAQQRSLQPAPGHFSPSSNYPAFIQGASTSVINGVPIQMQPNSQSGAQFLQTETYYSPNSIDPSVTKHDMAYSRRLRSNTHPEPVLPDLPLPPVVAPV